MSLAGLSKLIVLSGSKKTGASSWMSQNSDLAALAGLNFGVGKDSIATEVEILNSASVLMPIFDAVKERKPPETAKAMRFENWVKSAITAKNKKGTAVLSVEFRDTDKQLVLPITQMISKAYQSYSNRSRAREIANMIAYLKKQIIEIKPKAEASSRAASNYGYANSLGLRDGLPFAGNVAGAGISQDSGAKVATAGGSIEAARTAAQQKVKVLEVQVESH